MQTEQINGGRGAHLVHFYEADQELADTVAGYLKQSLVAGGGAIAIATEAHLRAIRQELASAGVDVRAAIEDQRLILLDAQGTLSKLLVRGQIDRDAFERVVGRTVRAACQRHSVIRAYGEMVDLLWQDGDIPGAIELETVWNELMAGLRFTLLCAYHSEAVSSPEHDDALRTMCQLHSSHQTSRDFQPDHTAPGAARRFIAQALRHWGHDGSVIDDARLVISELVSNAVRHTRSPFSVSITSDSPKLRIAVHDASSSVPVTGQRSEDAPAGGRGLQIVAALADDWGVERTPSGKVVWADLSPAPAQ